MSYIANNDRLGLGYLEKIKPYLQISANINKTGENIQLPKERKKLEGLYECILCACCSSACPSYWWNPDKFLGPAIALQSARFIHDSRDEIKSERLRQLEDFYSLLRCRGIMNCIDVCPKGLSPGLVISQLRREMLKSSL